MRLISLLKTSCNNAASFDENDICGKEFAKFNPNINFMKFLKPFIIIFSLVLTFSSCQKETNYLPAINSLQSDITALQKRSDSLSTALTKTNNTVLNLSAEILTLTNTQNNQQQNIDSIKTKIATILTSLSTLSTQVQQENTKISNLTGQLTQTNANISAINGQITQISLQIQQLNSQYSNLLAQLTTVLNQLSIPSSLASGLIAYFPFNGNANDMSGNNNNNGTVSGASLTTDRFGNLNSAYSFDGVSNYIELPVLVSLENSSKMTFSTWVNTNYTYPTDPITKTSYVFSQWSSTIGAAGVNIGVNIGVWSTKAYTTAFISDTQIVTNPLPIPTNTWANYTIVYDGTQSNVTQRLAVYVNGVFSSYVGNNNVPSTIGSLANRTVIGALIGANLAVGYPKTIGYYFSGKLDDIRIYNRVLTSSEIQYIGTH